MSDPETNKTEDSKYTSDPAQLEQKEQRSLSKITLLIFGFLIAVSLESEGDNLETQEEFSVFVELFAIIIYWIYSAAFESSS